MTDPLFSSTVEHAIERFMWAPCSSFLKYTIFDLTAFECRDKMAWFHEEGRFYFAFKNFFLHDCPKILLHLFEEDTLLILLVGKLWLKALYQVVIF